MGIIDRFSTIMKSNINALLDKAEDPEKIIDQTLRDLRENLADVKRETAAVMANEKRDQRAVEEASENVEKYEAGARNALKSGNEEDARKLLEAKARWQEKLDDAQKNLETSSMNADRMRQMHDKLVKDIRDLEDRQDGIKAKMANARAVEAVNKARSDLSGGSSIAAFERMEEKADAALDAAMAEERLNNDREAESDEALLGKYGSGASSASVDEELERMKQEMGL